MPLASEDKEVWHPLGTHSHWNQWGCAWSSDKYELGHSSPDNAVHLKILFLYSIVPRVLSN